MGSACVCPDTDEFVPAESSATEDLAKAELVDAVRDMADKGEADEDVETATGSEVFACEHISRSLSSVSALSLETSTPDFSGKWICCRVEGDWDAYLRERGTSWMMRKLAASVGYGVGKHTQTIAQNSDELEVVNLVVSTGAPKEERCVIKADGEAQEVLDPDGLLIRQKTRWIENVLVSEQFQSGAHASAVPMILKRFMQGHEMCTERTTAQGVVVRRFYSCA
mmetsp:Transcript_67419/g.158082  ORF Transcript_67419/g.158082 Transcript_67419/m.158082 type:complete len:224 (-) Transcript_67419:335-1006(-)